MLGMHIYAFQQNCPLTPILEPGIVQITRKYFSISSDCVFKRQWQLIMAHMTITLLAQANCPRFDALFKLHWTTEVWTLTNFLNDVHVPNKPRVPWTPFGFNLPRCLKKKKQHLQALPSVYITLKEEGKQKRVLPVLLFLQRIPEFFIFYFWTTCAYYSTFTYYSELVIE